MSTITMSELIAQDDYIEQIDWMCEQIKEIKRRVDELFPDRLNHHLRLLKLEEANE